MESHQSNEPASTVPDSGTPSLPAGFEKLSPQDQASYRKSQGIPEPTKTETEAVKPALEIPDKFKRDTPEETLRAVLQSYTELEKQRGKPADKPAETPVEDLKELQIPETKPEDKKPEGSPKINWQGILQGGEIDEATKGVLTKEYEIPEEVLGQITQLRQDSRELKVLKAEQVVGGRENLHTIINSVKEKYTPAQQAELNKVFATGSDLAIRGALKMLSEEFLGTTPQTQAQPAAKPGLVQATVTGGSSLKPFTSQGEMTAAMRDPRYTMDVNYNNEVVERIRLTRELEAQGRL